MALNEDLNFKFAAAEVTSIDTKLDEILAIINAASTPMLNLSSKKGIRNVSKIREPYANNAINQYAVDFPGLNSISVPIAQANNCWALLKQSEHFLAKVNNIRDRFDDLRVNGGYVAMKFTDDQYGNAEHNLGRNVAGVDVVYEGQNPLYDRERQGGDTNDPE